MNEEIAIMPSAITDGPPFGADAEHNQVGRGLIPGALAAPEFCQLVAEYRREAHPARPIVQAKIDGIRCIYLGGDKPRVLTREGQPFDLAASRCMVGLRAIEAEYGKPMMFDGEYAEIGGFDATVSAFRRGTGKGLLFLFDAVPLDTWRRAGATAVLENRLRELTTAVEKAHRPNVGVLHNFIMDADETERMAEGMWRRGFEGLVIKDALSPYVRGRSRGWMRLKQVETSTVTVIGSTAKGGLRCEDSNGVEFSLPPPTNRDLKLALAEAGDPLGLKVDVEHNGRTGSGTVRHARLVRVRDDLERRV